VIMATILLIPEVIDTGDYYLGTPLFRGVVRQVIPAGDR